MTNPIEHNGHNSINGHNGHTNGNAAGIVVTNGTNRIGAAGEAAGILKDRFAQVELTKPKLFPTKKEVIQKTGIAKNLAVFMFLFLAATAWFALPQSAVKDSSALVVPSRRVDLASPRDGFVERVFFGEGDVVKAGDLVLRVVSPEDRIFIREAELEADALRKEISAEEHEATLLSMKYKEAKNLFRMGSVKPDTVEESRLILITKEKRLAALKSRLLAAASRLTGSRERTRIGELRAPFQGRIISDAGVKEKAFVQSGDFLFTVAGEDSVVEVLLRESDYTRIETGAKARVKFYAFPERVYEGRVVGFKHFAERLPKSGIERHAVKALVRLQSMPSRLQNGMSAKVTLQAKQESLLVKYFHEMF